jgi:hypothetical protein
VIGRVEQLCRHLAEPGFDRKASEYGVADEVNRIVQSVRGGDLPDELFGLLDDVEHAFAEKGISGVTTTVRDYRQPSGGPEGHPTARLLRCPAPQRCSRLVPAGNGGAATCAIMQSPLDEIEL